LYDASCGILRTEGGGNFVIHDHYFASQLILRSTNGNLFDIYASSASLANCTFDSIRFLDNGAIFTFTPSYTIHSNNFDYDIFVSFPIVHLKTSVHQVMDPVSGVNVLI
jgi:hypothetical protein